MAGAPLVVGVDGGNSKTEAVLATAEGTVLARVRGIGTRSHVDGVTTMVAGLGELVATLRKEAGLATDAPIEAGAFFLANVDISADEHEVHVALDAIGLTRRAVVRNDALAPLRAGAPDGWGIAVVSGAGINAVGVDPAGREARFLALGGITGDWGGGYSVAEAGLGAAVRAGDGRGEPTVLSSVIPAEFGMESVDDVALAFSRGELQPRQMHQLAPVVFAAAEQGDAVATGIAHRLADEVVSMVTALSGRLGLDRAEVPVILSGGTLQRGPHLLIERISRRLLARMPHARPEVLQFEPVAGAVIEALEMVGAGRDAQEAVRHTLTFDRSATPLDPAR
jgi:N-acetylglucosamine kinase-like BadF-type ATPase